MSQSIYALLDDLGPAEAVGPTGAARSRRYTGFVHEHRAVTPETLDATWAAVDADLRAGLHAVLLADYEWGAALQGIAAAPGDAASGAVGGLRVLMFRQLDRCTPHEVAAWLQGLDGDAAEPSPAGAWGLSESVADTGFDDAIARIHEAIEAGETYQVNYTYRLRGQAFGSPVALYRRLRARQPVGYGALIALPPLAGQPQATRHVLSLSPELFLRHEGGQIAARPMKGTAPRRADPQDDAAQATWLQADEKNRAENLMIVDLLRNDLGRVAELGSVTVPSLFAVEPYATVWQMTSTVQARLRPEIGMPAVLRASFPCGSITGAPKHHTMGLIRQLEGTPRGLYCGAIGWVDAPAAGAQLGDFCLSVAIRTIALGEARDGLAPMQLGVGAGIVLDSVAADERAECRLKARFLTGLDPGFALIETMRCTPGGQVPLWDRHMSRLARSAAQLGFGFGEAALRRGFDALRPALAADGDSRVRLALHHDGRADWQHAPLAPLPAGPVYLRWADERLALHQPLAAHKTSARAIYDRSIRAAENEGAFDSLFLREDGVLVEGGRSSVFVKLGGRWWTPPLADGALPGVMRTELLADASLAAVERRLTRADVERAESLMVCNALRGALPVVLRT